jgi:hypothetical protein
VRARAKNVAAPAGHCVLSIEHALRGTPPGHFLRFLRLSPTNTSAAARQLSFVPASASASLRSLLRRRIGTATALCRLLAPAPPRWPGCFPRGPRERASTARAVAVAPDRQGAGQGLSRSGFRLAQRHVPAAGAGRRAVVRAGRPHAGVGRAPARGNECHPGAARSDSGGRSRSRPTACTPSSPTSCTYRSVVLMSR